MNVETDSQAMTEVALGLAMAFFAMMILAMMSMSMPSEVVASQAISTGSYPKKTFKEGVKVVENSKVSTDGKGAISVDGASEESQKEFADEKASDDTIIIFYQGRYLDVALQPLDVATIDAGLSADLSAPKRYILALSPNLSLSDVLIARAQISSPNLTITELDEAWMTRLAL